MSKKIIFISLFLISLVTLYLFLPFGKQKSRINNLARDPDSLDIKICKWKNNKLAALSITIDDNNEQDLEFWRNISERFDVKFTWFLITEAEESLNVKSWDAYNQLAKEGHSIQAHDDRNWYSSSTEQFLNPTEKQYLKRLNATKYTINSHILDNKCETYAYPWGQGNAKLTRQCYIAARGVIGLLNECDSIDYFNVNSISSVHLIKDSLSMRKYVLPIIDSTYTLQDKVYYGGWLCTHFHSVEELETKEKTKEFLKFIEQYKSRIWISTFPEIVKYAQERDSSKISLINFSEEKIEFELSNSFNNNIYNESLTVRIKLPFTWKNVEIVNKIKFTQKYIGDNLYLQFDVYPNDGSVIIKKVK